MVLKFHSNIGVQKTHRLKNLPVTIPQSDLFIDEMNLGDVRIPQIQTKSINGDAHIETDNPTDQSTA